MELVLVFYLLSGIIKGFLIRFGIQIPIDITLLFAVLTFFVFILESHKSSGVQKLRFIPAPVLFLMLFWFWMIFSLLYTSSTEFAYTKVLYFLTAVIPVWLVLKKHHFKMILFIKTYVIVVLILVFIYLPIASSFYVKWSEDELGFVRMYLAIGENLGFVVLILFFTRTKIFTKNLDIVLSLIAFLLLLVIGARGPLLFVVIILFIHFLFKQKRKILKLNFNQLVVLAILLVVSGFVAYSYRELLYTVMENSLKKLDLLTDFFAPTDTEKDPSVMVRVEHYKSSTEIIFRDISTFLRGTGIGSYEMEVFGTDGNNHPHNQLLEILTELGVIGLLVYVLFFISLLKNVGKPYIFISKLIILYSILNLLKSSSLVEIRIPLTIIALSLHPQNGITENFAVIKKKEVLSE